MDVLPPAAPYSRPVVVVVLLGLVLTGVVALVWGARMASFVLAGLSAGLGMARLILPSSRVLPMVVRDQWIDVMLLLGAAVGLVVMASVAPF